MKKVTVYSGAVCLGSRVWDFNNRLLFSITTSHYTALCHGFSLVKLDILETKTFYFWIKGTQKNEEH